MTQVVDKSSQRIRKMFGEIAPTYDRLNHLLSCNIDRRWRRMAVARIHPQPEEPILDVCTGTGDLALEFYRGTRGQSPIVGVDFCPEMLEIARRKQTRRGISATTVRFVEADATELPFSEASFAHVAVAFGLRNVADPQQGLREMIRVCRPGGTIAVLEFSYPRREPLKSLYGWYFHRVLPQIGRAVNRFRTSAYDYLPTSVGQFPAYEELAELLRANGLQNVRFEPFSFGIATLYLGVK